MINLVFSLTRSKLTSPSSLYPDFRVASGILWMPTSMIVAPSLIMAGSLIRWWTPAATMRISAVLVYAATFSVYLSQHVTVAAIPDSSERRFMRG